MEDKELIVAYLAGIFDGEGSISAHFRHGNSRQRVIRPSVQVKMAWLPTLNKFLERFGGSIRRSSPRQETNKALFHWALENYRDQAVFLSTVLPYLGEKRSQAELLLDYLKIRSKCPKTKIPEEVKEMGCVLHQRLKAEKRIHFGQSKSARKDADQQVSETTQV